MPMNASGAITMSGTTIGSSIAKELGIANATQISLNDTFPRALAAIPSGQISISNFYSKNRYPKKGIFGYGATASSGDQLSMTNLISTTGVVSTDTTGVGTARAYLAACGYGLDKGIFGFGSTVGLFGNPTATRYSMTNLVSNAGVVATDTTGVGSARESPAASTYGIDRGIFTACASPATTGSNLVSNAGVVATDVTRVGTARSGMGAAGYGDDLAIQGFGFAGAVSRITNLISNTGVVAADTAGVAGQTARDSLAAATYGFDKAIFGYGIVSTTAQNVTNLVSNAGVVATDTTGVGQVRRRLAASIYGGDKAIFGYGFSAAVSSITNLVSNTGTVAANVTGVGTARQGLAACGYSMS